MRIPQAIFTSLRGPKMAGYQLAAVSEGIDDDMARELNVWGPAHDSLIEETAEEPSVNFHPLGEDNFCLSLTRPAGAEYSGRRGPRVYTQMFILSREALAQFDNNPWLILRATLAAGRAGVYDELPARLRTLPLVGRAGEADSAIQQYLDQVGEESLADLTKAVLKKPQVGLATLHSPRLVVSALFHLLSPQDRLKVSFTTGLRHSPRRPFRLFAFPREAVIHRQFDRLQGVTVMELSASPAFATAH
jgi:hypothetical protein